MPIEWNIPDLTEAEKAVLTSDKVQSYANQVINTHTEVAKQSFKSKMDAMNAKLQQAEAALKQFDGISPDEIPVLKSARDNSKELTATLEEWKRKNGETEAALKEREAKLKSLEFNHLMTQTIHQYNTKNQATSVRDDAVDLIMILAEKRKTEIDGKTVFLKADGNPLVTDSGYASGVDFLNHLRTERPSLYNTPTGSGAFGQKSSGSANTMTRADFERLPPDKRAKVVLTHTITD